MHLARIQEHLDRFLEVYQGIFDRIQIKGVQQIQFSNVSKTSRIIESTRNFNRFLKALSNQLVEHDDLQNIIDEILADNNQFLYLLTFN